MRHDVAATRERGANGPDTDGVCRARGNSDRRAQRGLAGHRAWDLTSTQAFPSTPYYPRLTFSWCSSFLPFLVHNMRQPLYELRSQHTCFLQNYILLFTLREHYFINPLWISCSNTRIFLRRIFVSKAVWRSNLVKVLGQQPRYQRMPSSITLWQLFHRGPQFCHGTISY